MSGRQDYLFSVRSDHANQFTIRFGPTDGWPEWPLSNKSVKIGSTLIKRRLADWLASSLCRGSLARKIIMELCNIFLYISASMQPDQDGMHN